MSQDISKYDIEFDEYHYLQKARRRKKAHFEFNRDRNLHVLFVSSFLAFVSGANVWI